MKWKIEIVNSHDGEVIDEEEYEEYTIWASSFFEAFGYFSSCALDEVCRKCVVTAYYSGKPYGNGPVLVYDNP